MRINLNGETVEVQASRLSDILEECGYEHDRIATAVNGEIVHHQSRAETRLNEGDRLEVVAPVVGG